MAFENPMNRFLGAMNTGASLSQNIANRNSQESQAGYDRFNKSMQFLAEMLRKKNEENQKGQLFNAELNAEKDKLDWETEQKRLDRENQLKYADRMKADNKKEDDGSGVQKLIETVMSLNTVGLGKYDDKANIYTPYDYTKKDLALNQARDLSLSGKWDAATTNYVINALNEIYAGGKTPIPKDDTTNAGGTGNGLDIVFDPFVKLMDKLPGNDPVKYLIGGKSRDKQISTLKEYVDNLYNNAGKLGEKDMQTITQIKNSNWQEGDVMGNGSLDSLAKTLIDMSRRLFVNRKK